MSQLITHLAMSSYSAIATTPRPQIAQAVQSVTASALAPTVISPQITSTSSSLAPNTQIDRVSISVEAAAAAQAISAQNAPDEIDSSQKEVASDLTVRAADDGQEAEHDADSKATTQSAPETEQDVQQIKQQIQNDVEKNVKQERQSAQLQQIQSLKSRDLEVKNHEQAHAAIGGQYAGHPEYTYTKGPDGVNYATEGEVPIDVSRVNGDPQATIDKMQQVKAAALAPAQPSSQDRAVAAEASRIAAEARQQLLSEEHSTKGNQGSEIEGSQKNSSEETSVSPRIDGHEQESDKHPNITTAKNAVAQQYQQTQGLHARSEENAEHSPLDFVV